MYVSEKLAEKICAVLDLPPGVMEATRRCTFDAVAAAVPGQGTKGGVASRDGAIAAWGEGPAPIWFSSARSTAIGATFVNSAATCMLDIDDGHRVAAGHPGASIVPAVLTAVQQEPALAPRAMTAIAIGYEIGLRIAASRDVRNLDTVITGRWCGQGVAAAIGWLKGMPPGVIAQAIAAAGAVAPLMTVADFTEVGNHVKEAIPYGTINGLVSLHMAQSGLRAPLDILDDTSIFDADTLLNGFAERWLIETCYFKPYSCCRWIHAPIDGLMKILANHKLSFRDITGIRVETFGNALKLPNHKTPELLEGGQFSIPFCLGVAAVRGTGALLPMTDTDLLRDPEILSVSSLVDVVFDGEMDSYFPSMVPARIFVSCNDQVFTETIMAPFGESTNPMGWSALSNKFDALASGSLIPEQVASLKRALGDMRAGSLTSLLAELAQPAVLSATLYSRQSA